MGAQRTTTRSRQRGLSFIGVIFVGLIAVAAFAIGGQSVPIFLEYFAIKKAAAKAARDGSTVPEIRAAFDHVDPAHETELVGVGVGVSVGVGVRAGDLDG